MVPRLGLTPGPSCSSAQGLTWPVGLAAFRVQSTAREIWPQQLSCFRFRGKGVPMKPNMDLGLPITFHPLWCAAAVLPLWPGSGHSLRATGRSSSTSPASSLPVTAKNHSISSPRNIRDDVLQCLLAPLHLSDPEVPPLPTPPPCHSKRPTVPSESFRRDLGNPFDTNSILRYK